MTKIPTQLTLELPPSPTKAQEAAFLGALVTFFAPRTGTYLSDLFTEPLLEYVQKQVAADFPVDVYGALKEAQQDALDKRQEALDQARRGTDAEMKLAALRVETQKAAAASVAEVDKLRTELSDLRRKLYDAQTSTLEQRVRADKLQADNDRLKVMLFDLEHPFNANEEN